MGTNVGAPASVLPPGASDLLSLLERAPPRRRNASVPVPRLPGPRYFRAPYASYFYCNAWSTKNKTRRARKMSRCQRRVARPSIRSL